MKKAILSFGVMLLGVFALSSAVAQQGPQLSFDNGKEIHDYGNIEQNANGTCEFAFTNVGDEPLIISNAKGSCGCTVPQWPKEPIAPGESGVIKVKYDTKRIGPINKSVTLTTNDATTPTKVLRIKGNISAPAKQPTTPVRETPAGAPTTGGGR